MTKRKALLVGIDAYPAPNTLNGCVADAVDMHETLVINGFPHTRIVTLTNKRATKANILSKLEWLCKDANVGDVLVFFYSGHGTQIPDLNNEEVDHIDEAICPVDIDFEKETYIIDDELGEIFDKTPTGVRLDVILDSCFAGTATRSLTRPNEMTPVFPRIKKSRFMPPPIEHQLTINNLIPSLTSKTRVGVNVTADSATSQKNALWSACLANQESEEMDIDGNGQVRGLFTYVFARILRRSNGNMTREEIFRTAKTTMANAGYDQIPDLEVSQLSALKQFPFKRIFEDEPSEIKP